MSTEAIPRAFDTLWARKRQARKAARRSREQPTSRLLINSLMDAFVIILCFLLKSFGADPVQIRESEQLTLPRSPSEQPLEDAVVIGVSTHSIQVDDHKVVELHGGIVDEAHKQDGGDSLLINPLRDALEEKASHLKMLAARTGGSYEGMVLIVADRSTRFRLLSEVLYTAGQAEFGRFKFVAAEGDGS